MNHNEPKHRSNDTGKWVDAPTFSQPFSVPNYKITSDPHQSPDSELSKAAAFIIQHIWEKSYSVHKYPDTFDIPAEAKGEQEYAEKFISDMVQKEVDKIVEAVIGLDPPGCTLETCKAVRYEKQQQRKRYEALKRGENS